MAMALTAEQSGDSFFERLLGLPAGALPIPLDTQSNSLLTGARKSDEPKDPVLWTKIASSVEALPRPVLQVWYWPDAAPFAVSLSHDVDEVRWSWRRRLLMAGRHPGTLLEKKERYWNFDRVVALEESRGVRSSWYFVADGSHPRDPPYRLRDVSAIMRELQGKGFEVGVHGSFLSYNDAGRMKREHDAICQTLSRPVPGVRQHFLNFDPNSTWRHQEAAGFSYDSSMARNDTSGFSVGLALPYRPPARKLLEIPLILMDGQLFWHERFTVEQAIANCQSLASRVQATGGLLTLNWHQHTFDEYSFPGWWEVYSQMVDFLRARTTLFLTSEQVMRWWEVREGISVKAKSDGAGSGEWTVTSPVATDTVAVRLLGGTPRYLESSGGGRTVIRDGEPYLVLQLKAGEPLTVSAGW